MGSTIRALILHTPMAPFLRVLNVTQPCCFEYNMIKMFPSLTHDVTVKRK